MKGGEAMDILIDNKSGAPIYDQIYSQIKTQIISGALREDELLPSIRNAGAVFLGAWSAKNVELLREENLKKIEEHMEEIAKLAATCNLSCDEIVRMFQYIMEG